MSVTDNIKRINERVALAAASAGRAAGEITLVAAAKTNPASAVREAILAGVTCVGENRVQELLAKKAEGAYDGAQVHLIGHLQKNKVKQTVGVADLIQSVDSAELMRLIHSRAAALGIVQEILLEVNIGGEASKSGLSPAAVEETVSLASGLSHIRLRGLMAIPPVSLEKGGNRPYFAQMYKLFVDIGAKKYDNVSMDFLSMGMSGDFEDAIAEGSNMIRVGSSLFGARAYPAPGTR